MEELFKKTQKSAVKEISEPPSTIAFKTEKVKIVTRKGEKENKQAQAEIQPKTFKPTVAKRVAVKSSQVKSRNTQKGSTTDSKRNEDVKREDSFSGLIEPGSGVFAMNNFLGLYSPAKVHSRASKGTACYNLIFYNGEKQVCHRKYILTNRDPKFYSANVVPFEEVKKTLDPALTKSDIERLVAVVEGHTSDLKDIAVGKKHSLRDEMFLFNHAQRNSLFSMSRPASFRQSEFAYLCRYLSTDFIEKCQEADPTFKKQVSSRFASAGHSFDMSVANYALLVLAPELVIRVILQQYKHLKSLEEAAEFYLENSFETETSYVALMYTSREMYRYTYSETKMKN